MGIAVAVSGGRDSLLALALLARQEQPVVAVHAFLAAQTPQPVLLQLQAGCDALGVDLHVVDARQRFRELIISPFARAYLAGETPNPCAWCNTRIKFGLLLDTAQKLGATSLATGHYARLEQGPDGPELWPGRDRAKDQSYFLSLLKPRQLATARFPLGAYHKQDVLPALHRLGLQPPLPGESQEICFIPDNYRAFLANLDHDLPPPGPITHLDGREVGTHHGLWRYTIGQRKGLVIAWSEPLYVLRKDIEGNRLIVGERQHLHARGCRLHGLNALTPRKDWPEDIFLQTRYRQRPFAVRVSAAPVAAPDSLKLEFLAPREPAAPGQIGALSTSRGRILAAGVIQA